MLRKRFQDLASAADRRGCVTFTDFLNLNEQNILHETLQKFSWIQGETFGGYVEAERQIAAFVPDALSYEWEYPISCLQIRPLHAKFAEDLSHRDVLGALMHLGIERGKTGDIALCGGVCYVFCCTSMAELICRELTRIRHTAVSCEVCSAEHFSYAPTLQTVKGSVSSVRLDAVMALAFQSSRSSLLSLIADAKVFVNGRLITTNAYALKEQDIVSVRGLGRFRYVGVLGRTKKDRCMIELEKYV